MHNPPVNDFRIGSIHWNHQLPVPHGPSDPHPGIPVMMRGVQRTVAVFDCFTPQRMSLTLQEIAEAIGLAKSTTFRIVQSLEQAGYLIRLEDQKYCLSLRFTRLAGMVMGTLGIRQVARPLMAELARKTNETVTLNLATGRDRTCIDVIDTPSPLMSLARPGQHVPLDFKGATEKTLMAHRPLKEQARLAAASARLAKCKPDALLAGLARIREEGFCCTHGERVLGLSAMAAPILDDQDTADYCISITAPTVRLQPKIHEFSKLLLDTSMEISRRLGAGGLAKTELHARKPAASRIGNKQNGRAGQGRGSRA